MENRDIVWITLESVRWDHTSFSGHSRDTTPELFELSQRRSANAFNNCYSHGIYTRSSSASILTGRAASNHGVGIFRDVLPESVSTIPQHLSEHGYRTVGISPNGHLSYGTELDRGFDDFVYINRDTIRSAVPYPILVKYLLNIRNHSGGFTADTNKHCLSYLNNHLLKRYAERAKSTAESVFLYAHYGDTHHSYCPPEKWRRHFEQDLVVSVEDAIEFAVYMKENILQLMADGSTLSTEEWNALEVMYDTLIAYVDHMVAEVVSEVSEVLDDPIVVITSDHGENFGEMGLLGHRLTINDALANVPLIVDGLELDVDSDALIQHADVFKMIFEDIGLDVEIPAGVDVRKSRREFAVAQLGGKRCQQNLNELQKYNPEFPRERFHETDMTALITEDRIYRRSEDKKELFDTSSPEEVELLDSAELEAFEQKYQEWYDTYGKPILVDQNVPEKEIDGAIQQHLRDMGYLAD